MEDLIKMLKDYESLVDFNSRNKDQLLKNYASVIDEQRKEIEALKESVEYYADMMLHYME